MVLTKALALRIETVERVDRMVAGTEVRRHVALREIDRHRASRAIFPFHERPQQPLRQ